MKRFFPISLGVVVMVFSSLLFTACKKHVNPAHPAPDNNRLLSYTKFITPNVGSPVNQSYRFYYDDKGRVSQIAYLSNDAVEITAGTAQRLMAFRYFSDTIIKTTTAVQTTNVMEVDTFIINLRTQQLTHVFMPGYEAEYDYGNRKLLVGITEHFTGGDARVTVSSTYTSNNGDILSHVYDGNVSATFQNVVTPLTVNWNYGLTAISHPGLTTTTDQISNYSDYSLTVDAVDANGTTVGPLTVSQPLWKREEHRVYPDLLNRPGDIYYLQTFTLFGIAVYQNEHLVKSITGTGPLIPGLLNIDYTIDADSKITQTYVTGYGYMNNSSVVYKMQYETY